MFSGIWNASAAILPHPPGGPVLEAVDTLVRARWIAPVEPDAVLEDHALAIRGGRLLAVLPAREALARYAPRELVERPRHLLTPGLVDAYGDLLAGSALLAGAPFAHGPGAAERRRLVLDLALAELACAGVSTFADAGRHPDELATAALDTGLRCVLAVPIEAVPTPWATDADQHFAKATDFHDAFRDHPLVATAFALPDAGALDDAALARLRVLADQIDARCLAPLHGSRAEVEASRRRHGLAPLARLARLGLATPQLVAVHATRFGADEIELAARVGMHVVHCPGADLAAGEGIAPLPALRDAGARVALGTGRPGLVTDRDPLRELRLASSLAATSAGAPDAALARDPGAALRLATLAGAEALGLDADCGSLAAGKWADVACFDLGRLPALGRGHPLAALLAAGARDLVADVWVAGRALVRDSRALRLDPAELATRAARAGLDSMVAAAAVARQ